MRKTIIGVMGPGDSATDIDKLYAFELGTLIAKEGWVTLSGGRDSGVMDAVCQGAREAGGLTVGILPTKDKTKISGAVDIPIISDMGSARNNINVLSSDVVIACGMGCGTASEVALALKSSKDVILLNNPPESKEFFKSIGKERIHIAEKPEEALEIARKILSTK